MMVDISTFKVFLQTSKYDLQKSYTNLEIEDYKSSTKTLARDTLKRIDRDHHLQQEFEKILQQEKEISNWYFWKDINKILEMDKNDQKVVFSFLQKIVRDYLNVNSPHQVKKKILLFFLISFSF